MATPQILHLPGLYDFLARNQSRKKIVKKRHNGQRFAGRSHLQWSDALHTYQAAKCHPGSYRGDEDGLGPSAASKPSPLVIFSTNAKQEQIGYR